MSIPLKHSFTGQTGSAGPFAQNEKVMQQNNDKFCTTNVAELKENIPGKKPLFYVGSDSASNYLVFYYDKTKKIVVGFKVPYNDFKPPIELQFKEDNYYLKKYPVYLDDINTKALQVRAFVLNIVRVQDFQPFNFIKVLCVTGNNGKLVH